MIENEFSDRIIRTARLWLGTPYVHQASTLGAGADCLGLIRGVWRELLGEEPEKAPDYALDWGEVSKAETMLAAARRWFVPVPLPEAVKGALVLFRWRKSGIVRHAGILTGGERFIHAYEKAGVVETHLGSHWKRRIAATFHFPNSNPAG